MMSAEVYHTAFDVTTAGYKSWFVPVFGLIFVAMGLAMPKPIENGLVRETSPWRGKWSRRAFLGFAILWTSIAFLATFGDYQSAVGAMRDHKAEIVEGQVVDFHPHLGGSHKSESFVVQGVKFKYANSLVTAGFNQDASHGGPIREGLIVKIWHLNGEILRLDIRGPD